jgi:hypothetical protein
MPRTALPLLLPLLVVLSCTPTEPGDDDDDVTLSGPGSPLDVVLDADVPTVATASWRDGCADPDHAWVEFGLDTTYGQLAPARATDDGGCQALIWGMKPAAVYHYRAVEEIDGEAVPAADARLLTGPAPNSLPIVRATHHQPDAIQPGFLLTQLLTTPPAAVILDRDGDYVWWYQEDEGYMPGLFRAQLSRDRETVLFQRPSGGPNFQDKGELIQVTPTADVVAAIPGSDRSSHDYDELPDGTIAILRSHAQTVADGRIVYGDQIIELAPDGSETQIWTVWDWAEHDPLVFTADLYGADWSHANILRYDEARDAYYVSMRGFHAIWGIDRTTGDVFWRFGGDSSDYTDADGNTDLTALQHGFQLLDSGIVVHDNGTRDALSSRVIEYALDDDHGLAEPVLEYVPDPPYFNYALGDVVRHLDGNTLVAFSMGGLVHEVSPDGELLWELATELGSGIGYVTWQETLTGGP